MKFNAFFKAVFLLTIFGLIVSCDKDFNEIGADLIDDIHYDFDKAEFSTLAYNMPTGAVQTNNLPINSLGYFNNGVFGETTASFLTQVELATTDPKFYGVTSVTSIDSVYLYVPYYSNLVSTDATTGDSTYSLDSIHGEDNKLKLSVYRSQYFLRNLDPDNELQEQRYYSNQIGLMNSTIAPTNLLNTGPISENDEFKFTNDQIKILKNNDLGNGTVKERLAPGIFLNLNKQKFYDAIFTSAANGKLVDNNVFKDYFKGLFFKAEGINQKNALARLNFAQGKITIVYKGKDSETDTNPAKRKTLVLNLGGNSVNFFENVNSSQYTNALTNPDVTNGQSKLYLKGGEGSMAVIKLFGPDLDSNGVADELEDVRTKGWLVNEANLVFTIDNTTMASAYDSDESSFVEFEPNRILLYDLNNKRVLVDYGVDITTNSFFPKFNKLIHDGIIKKGDDKKGIQYKVRITNHIRNLISKDSTNVNLGLVVTESINNVGNSKLLNSFTAFGREVKYIPSMSVASPLGTVLWGTNLPASDSKRLKLEIFYTKPE